MSKLTIQNLTFTYADGTAALHNITIDIRPNELFILFGPSRSGKTTLFHVIMGLLKPSAGVIEIFGKERRSEKDFRDIRHRIGLLFQDADDQLFSPTVLEDVAFGPLNLGMSREEADQVTGEFNAMIRESDETEFLKQYLRLDRDCNSTSLAFHLRKDGKGALLTGDKVEGWDELATHLDLRAHGRAWPFP